MEEYEELRVVRRNALDMPEDKKILFYQLKKRKSFVGLLLSIFFFGGGGLIYAGKVARGFLFAFIVATLLLVTLFTGGAGKVYVGDMAQVIQSVILFIVLVLYLYAVKDTHKSIEEYNKQLHQAVFGPDLLK